MDESTSTDDHTDLVKLVRKYATVNTDGILDLNCKIFSVPSIEGLIGYRVESKNAVVFGDPVCAKENWATLTLDFVKFCKEHKLGIVFTIVSEEFAEWATSNLSSTLIEFGEVFVLNPQESPLEKTGSKAVLLRKKVKHATKEGLSVKEYTNNNAEIEHKIEAVAASWLQKRHGIQVYLSPLRLFENKEGKRWFYAEHKNQIVGIFLLNELKSRNSWLLNNVMVTADAPNGTSELLVTSGLKTLKDENCSSVIIGPVPAKELKRIEGASPLLRSMAKGVYYLAKKFLHLEGHSVFWEKFQPKIESSFLLFSKNNLNLTSIFAILSALNVSKK